MAMPASSSRREAGCTELPLGVRCACCAGKKLSDAKAELVAERVRDFVMYCSPKVRTTLRRGPLAPQLCFVWTSVSEKHAQSSPVQCPPACPFLQLGLENATEFCVGPVTVSNSEHDAYTVVGPSLA